MKKKQCLKSSRTFRDQFFNDVLFVPTKLPLGIGGKQFQINIFLIVVDLHVPVPCKRPRDGIRRGLVRLMLFWLAHGKAAFRSSRMAVPQ